MLDPKIQKERLLNAVPIEPEVLEKARAELFSARRLVALSKSVVASIIVGMCHFTFTRDPAFKTFAVTLAADGNPMLVVNPDYLLEIGYKQAVFALIHEAYHLLLMHLYSDPALRKNENWTLATEACINNRVKNHLDVDLIRDDAGKVIIVDPENVYKSYQKGANELGLTPVDRKTFFQTDMGCFSYLEMLPKPPRPRNMSECVHASGNDGEGSDSPLDPEEVGKFMDKVLESAIQAAKGGHEAAKGELLDLMDASPEASEKWGDLGAGILRGETSRSKKTDLWEQWVANSLASRMADGSRWRYNTKIPWDPRVSATGKQPHKHGAVFVDASGSMHPAVLDKIAAMIGDLDNITVEWHSFDGEVWPFDAGEGFRGGGGTSFQIIEDHVNGKAEKRNAEQQCCEEELDFVLVLTDGYAPHIRPSEADKWVWVIVPGGDTWPADAGMACREVHFDQ